VITRLAIMSLAAVAAANACGSSQRGVAAPALASSQRATFVRDVDGDTIKVRLSDGTEHSVRLIGIDTPETHKPGVKVECGGREASALAAAWAKPGDRVTLAYDPTQDRSDRYGRLLAYVSANGRSLQLSQLRAGWAEVYVYAHHPFQRVESFRRAQESAKKHGRGVWGSCGGDFHDQQPSS
jgi:micrococcal nuclease